jgi:hypothetical protein
MRDLYVSFKIMISQEMMPDIYVFGSRMLTWIFGYFNGALIVT